jgi:ABC-2 type transport system permease protein
VEWLLAHAAVNVAIIGAASLLILGAVADSQDGVIAASNTIALPLLFLSETFVPPTLLPTWFRPAMAASPLTYFARGTRAITSGSGGWTGELLLLVALAVVFLTAGAAAIPRGE